MAGMTSLPEAGLARELGLDYAGLAVVSNWGAGVTGEPLSEDDIAETLKGAHDVWSGPWYAPCSKDYRMRGLQIRNSRQGEGND